MTSCFFFSSRRRHTRWTGDWSSDVCSSDLRRIPDYPLMFETWNKISTIGAFGMGLAQILFFYIVVYTISTGKPAPQLPWEGADSLEWTHLPTPAPYHTFETQPTIR